MPNSSEQDKKSSLCEFCKTTEQERPIFTADYQGKKLQVCARCLPGLIHG